MRILMAATGDFAVPAFAALSNAGHEIVALVTQPDRPAGRGRHVAVARVKQLALDRDVPVLQPEHIGDPASVDHVARLAPELLLVVAYGQKIPPEVCELPPRGAINMHGSLLPELRGAAPHNWAIIRGMKETGVTVQHLAQTMDAGDVLGMRRVAVGPRETAPELHDRLAALGADLVVDVLADIAAGTARPEPQDASRVTYAPRLRKEDGLVDWTRSAGEIDCAVRGLKPWPEAYTYLQHDSRGQLRLIIEDVQPLDAPAPAGTKPGSLVETRKRLVVATGDGLLEVARLRPQASRSMTGQAFCNGHQVREGDRFGPPAGEGGP